MELNSQIIRIRRERGLTQEALAERLNISRQAVTKWENGEAVPEITRLIDLADVFGVSVDLLLGRDATNFDRLSQEIQRIAEKKAAGQLVENDVTVMVNRYMQYMKTLGISDQVIIDGLLFMCTD